MLLTDYYRSTKDATWDIGRQLGVKHGVIRLPEDAEFCLTDRGHWTNVYKRFMDFGIRPVIIEPMPNAVHDHIKVGDELRDKSIEDVIKMFPIMDELDIRTICFNWMAYVGWTRTENRFPARGGACVTAFDLNNYKTTEDCISEVDLWQNYEYFIKAAVPEAEKYGIKLALHPDDPPLPRLGNVSRIMINYGNIDRAVRDIVSSSSLGITFCQATFHMMGEDLYEIIPKLADKIMFIHFRNAEGTKTCFHETFHDNGALDMPRLFKCYQENGVDVPVRVDHVPTMVGEDVKNAGYDAMGRLFAIGYLKGIMESITPTVL